MFGKETCVREQELHTMNPFHTNCVTVAQQVGKTAFQLANYISGKKKKLNIDFVIVIK
jgi:hypothetical protein